MGNTHWTSMTVTPSTWHFGTVPERDEKRADVANSVPTIKLKHSPPQRQEIFFTHACKKSRLSMVWMPQFDGWKSYLRHQRVFAHILGQFQNVGCPKAGIFRAHAKKIFIGVWVGNAPIRCLRTKFATRVSVTFWGGNKMPVTRETGFSRTCEKFISWRCGGQCPNSMVGNWICDTGAFFVAFWGSSLMSATWEPEFFDRMPKNISWRCGGECLNLMVGNLICNTGAFWVVEWNVPSY